MAPLSFGSAAKQSGLTGLLDAEEEDINTFRKVGKCL